MFNALLRCKQLPQSLLEKSTRLLEQKLDFSPLAEMPQMETFELILEGRLGKTQNIF